MKKRVKAILKDYINPAILCVGLAYALGATPWMQRLENVPLDLITQYRVRYQKPADARVVTIGIDDGSIEDNGRWPWDRTVFAKFSNSIAYGKPACVSWDILFTEKSKNEK
jgi:CHASE2 domain-containing sensor protein